MNNVPAFAEFCKTHGNFMQSPEWISVKSGWKAEVLTVENRKGETDGSILILIKKIPFTGSTLFYAPRGPVCDLHDTDVCRRLTERLRALAEEHDAAYLKIDPLIEETDELSIRNLTELGFQYHPEKFGYATVQSRENYILDLQGKDEDSLLASFHSKYRYNIRVAERKGVRTIIGREELLKDFTALMKETSRRDGFCSRGESYYRKLLCAFKGNAFLCLCRDQDGFPLSGALCICYNGTLSYLYGCSSSERRNRMPNYLMQWTLIREALRRGCRFYDFCGIPYWYDTHHRNYGVYRFKKGFNGRVVTYAGEFDYPFKPRLYALLERALRVRSKLRKLAGIGMK